VSDIFPVAPDGVVKLNDAVMVPEAVFVVLVTALVVFEQPEPQLPAGAAVKKFRVVAAAPTVSVWLNPMLLGDPLLKVLLPYMLLAGAVPTFPSPGVELKVGAPVAPPLPVPPPGV
jgi:hypothetical protein